MLPLQKSTDVCVRGHTESRLYVPENIAETHVLNDVGWADVACAPQRQEFVDFAGSWFGANLFA